MPDLHVTYDKIANAAYVYVDSELPEASVAYTYSCDPDDAGMINLDFDEDGRIIGVEVLAADAKLPRSLLDRAERIDLGST